MGKIVYIITKGNYSDYGICAVTMDKEKAELYQKRFTDRWDKAEIEEWPLDEDADKLHKMRPVYFMEIYDDGYYETYVKEYSVDPESYAPTYKFVNHVGFEVPRDLRTRYKKRAFQATLLADDLNHALKIAMDKRAEMLAEMEGIT